MQDRPLPDFASFRRTLLWVCMGALAIVWLTMAMVSGGLIVFWVVYGTFFLVIVYGLQAATLEGDGAPHFPMSKWSVLGLSVVLAFFDALLAHAWYVVMRMLATTMQLDAIHWADEFAGVGIVGLLVGFVINSLSGFYLPRYAYLRLLLVGHFIGLLLMLVPAFYVRLSGGEVAAEIRIDLETLSASGFAGCILLAMWGIAPAAYLIAYRGYTRRLHLPANRLADEGEID